MSILSISTQHCLGTAATRLQSASVVWSGFMGYLLVKYGPYAGIEDRMQEVRG